MIQLSKVLGISSGLLIFVYLSVQDDSSEFILLYFILSFYGVIENQLFYFLKYRSNLYITKGGINTILPLFSRDILHYWLISIFSLLCFVLISFFNPHSGSMTYLPIIILVVFLKQFATLFEISFELTGNGERAFVVKNVALFISLIIVIGIGEQLNIDSKILLFIYYILTSLSSIILIAFLIKYTNSDKIYRVNVAIQDENIIFQFKLFYSTLVGYISSQYLFLQIIDDDVIFYKFTALLFVFGNTIIAIVSSPIISKRAISTQLQKLIHVDMSTFILIFCYLLIFTGPMLINLFSDFFMFFSIGSEFFTKASLLLEITQTKSGQILILIMLLSNIVLIQLIKTAVHYRKIMIEPIYYSNSIILISIMILVILNVSLSPIHFSIMSLTFSLIVLLELFIFRKISAN
jgi:hypothetical protein